MSQRAPRLVVVGLGPAGPELVSTAALDAIAAHPPAARWARTDRHPAIAVLGEHSSFDDVYDDATDLADVYRTIVARLVELAGAHGSVLYAVPGSPSVAERTVELLRSTGDVDVATVPALSFLDLAWDRLGVDPLAAGVRIVDGQRFEVEAAGQVGPLLVAQCDRHDVLSAIKLAVDGPPPADVTVLQRLGLPEERVFTVPWDELDRSFDPDHLTSLWLPALAAPVGAELLRFSELVRTLRERCPWDRAQTHGSLRPFVIEEAYEVADAIDQLVAAVGRGGAGDDGDGGGETGGDELGVRIDELEEELGDLLFQVVFHAALAAEEGWFTLADVARGVHDKLVHRHPHVFGDVHAPDAGTVVANWEAIKRGEKGRASVMDGIPGSFPPRLFAAKVAKRAAKVGVEADLAAEEAALDRAEAALLAAARRVEAAARAREAG